MRRWMYGLGLTAAVFVGCGWFAAPRLVGNYIEAHHPGVRIGGVDLAWKRLTLSDVEIDRPGIKGRLTRVVAVSETEATIEGGDLFIDLDTMPKGNGGGERKDIKGLLDRVEVHKGTVKATAKGVRLDSNEVCFASATVEHPLLELAEVTQGCVGRQRDVARIAHMTIKPARYPDTPFAPKLPFLIEDAVVRDRVGMPTSFSIARVTYGAYEASGFEGTLIGGKLSIGVHKAKIDLPIVFHTPVSFRDVTTTVNVDSLDAVDVRSAGATVHLRPKDLSASGDEPCQTWLEALPEEMRVGPLASLQFEGNLAVSIQVRPTPKITMKSTCRAKCDPMRTLRGPFEYTAYNAKGETFTRTSGPRSKDWIPLGGMSPTLSQAVVTLEDPGFLSHKGFIPMAFENSLKMNVEADKFVRGGSTITMQLVKNLWLRRNKNLGRKVQETLLATAMESCMTKDQIIELYLNVVEYGPDLYGIGPAAKRYFNMHPMALDAVQSFYLASILPAPRKAAPPDKGTMDRIEKLMRRLADNGRLPDGMAPSDTADTPVDTAGWETP